MRIQDALRKIAAAEALLAEAKHLLTEAQIEEDVAPLPQTSPQEQGEQEAVEHLDTLESIISTLLQLGLDAPDDEKAESRLIPLLHSSIDAKTRSNLIRFNWARFKAQVRDYLQNPDSSASFVIARKQDRSHSGMVEHKIFLEAKNRNPVPLIVRKDDAVGGLWRILTFSL